MTEQTTTTTPKPKKEQKAKKVYVLKNGTEARSAASTAHNAADVARLEFRFVNGTTRTVKVSDFEADIKIAATWHGFAQKLGDAYSDSAKKGQDPVDMFDDLLDNIKSGMWVEKGEAGEAAPTLLVEAVMAAMTGAGLSPVEETVKAKLSPRDGDGNLDKAKAKEERAGALANPAVKAEYERIKLERQQAKAKEAKAAAKGATADLSAFA